MQEFVDKTGISKTDGSCCVSGNGNNEPDLSSNIENCYHCTKSVCGCNNDSNYKEELVKKMRELIHKGRLPEDAIPMLFIHKKSGDIVLLTPEDLVRIFRDGGLLHG